MKSVILAAGFGSRLWPLSTSARPKQFLPLIDNESLLSYTYRHLSQAVAADDIYILILEGMQELVKQALPDFETSRLIIVPERRNTLPHTLWALKSITKNENEPVLFKSVDHFIIDETAFSRSLRECVEKYASETVTILGSKFKEFNTNDGYCVVANNKVVRFLEKPSKAVFDRASKGHDAYRSPLIYIASQRSLSNAIDQTAAEWKTRAHEVLASDKIHLREHFLAMPFLDISNELFAKSQNLDFKAIPYDFIDVGRFEEIYRLNSKDGSGNVLIGQHIILDGDCSNNLVVNDSAQPLVVISRSDSIIVQTDNGSLISSFAGAKRVGEIYKQQIHS